jgi:tetratricopeptide (TPR) repeat protein
MGRFETAILSLALATSLASTAAAQIPDKFTNLKVLPKDISKDDLLGRMRGFSSGLGVGCGHCHVAKDNSREMDFASDEKREKDVAREMLKMTASIAERLEALPAHEGEKGSVSCYTCHRGLATPPNSTLMVLDESAKKDGIAAALQRYRDLRKESYGQGQYDLSDRALASFAGGLVEAHQLDDARAALALAHEYYPESARVESAYGQLHLAAGEKDKARESFQKALALDPKDRAAQWGLRQLDAPPKKP